MLEYLALDFRTVGGAFFWIALIYYIYSILTRDQTVMVSLNCVGWPLLGTYLRFESNIHEKLAHLRKKRGEIFSAYLGSEKVVVLNSEKAIKDAFSKIDTFENGSNHPYGATYKSIFFTHGLDLCGQTKNHFIQNFDIDQLEEKVQLEIRHFLNLVEGYHGCQLDFDKILDRSTANIMFLLVFGKIFQYGEPELMTLIALLNEISNNINQSDLHLTFPGVNSTPSKTYNDSNAFQKAKEICLTKIKEHKDTFNSFFIKDFVDSNCNDQNGKGSSPMTDEDLALASMNLIVAGTDAVSTCIMWCMYTLATYPDVKEKILKEVDILSQHATPSFSDMKSMPYVQAFIREIIRWKTIVPISALKYTSSDTTVCEQDIPKGTNVLANFWAVNHDPEIWDEPNTFKPERFLKGRESKLMKSSISFSYGCRKCPGETIIHKEVFLYIVSIMQSFDVRFLPGVKPDIEKEVIVSNRPRNFEICMPPRYEYKRTIT